MVTLLRDQCWEHQEMIQNLADTVQSYPAQLAPWAIGFWLTGQTGWFLVNLLQNSKWTVSGNCVSLIMTQEVAGRIFFTAKMHSFY